MSSEGRQNSVVERYFLALGIVSSFLHVRTRGLFTQHIRINLELLETVDSIPWTGVEPVSRPLPAQGYTSTSKRTIVHASAGIRTDDSTRVMP